MTSGNLKFLEPSGPLQPVTGLLVLLLSLCDARSSKMGAQQTHEMCGYLKFFHFILLLFLSSLDAKLSGLFRFQFYYDTINLTRHTVSEYSLNGSDHLEDLRVNVRIILKLIFK
jgi:hypothetical protein